MIPPSMAKKWAPGSREKCEIILAEAARRACQARETGYTTAQGPYAEIMLAFRLGHKSTLLSLVKRSPQPLPPSPVTPRPAHIFTTQVVTGNGSAITYGVRKANHTAVKTADHKFALPHAVLLCTLYIGRKCCAVPERIGCERAPSERRGRRTSSTQPSTPPPSFATALDGSSPRESGTS